MFRSDGARNIYQVNIKKKKKNCQFADNVTLSHMENIQTHYDSFFLRQTENNAQASFRRFLT